MEWLFKGFAHRSFSLYVKSIDRPEKILLKMNSQGVSKERF